MKRGRKPPKTWRRNMLAGVVLLAILDGTILSASHDLARAVIALAITVLVGAFVAWTWVSNSRLEREEAGAPSQEGRRG